MKMRVYAANKSLHTLYNFFFDSLQEKGGRAGAAIRY